MEKTISPEERIRRAEEIYYRRRLNNGSVRMSSSQVKDGKEKRQITLYKKVIIQVLICILIYLIFSLIKEANYIFSDEVLNKTKQFLTTDINFNNIANSVGGFIKENQDKLDFLSTWINGEEQQENTENLENVESTENAEETNEQEENTEEEQNSENIVNEAKENDTVVANTLTGIGGATSENVEVETTSDTTKKTQMELDAEYVKENFKLQLPVKGTVTSGYGEREETEIVSATHQGIDIGVNEGTTIVAAMEGTVSLVSDEGEYGTHVKIVNEEITTIYAHCSKILVKEGEKVKKGEKIALSGNTGRTTGPHLHFEILRENRAINPELVLDWGRFLVTLFRVNGDTS